jgi:hypothetical protein
LQGQIAVHEWTVDDVGAWLTSKNLAAHVERFREHGVTGAALLQLKLRDIQKMGVAVCSLVVLCLLVGMRGLGKSGETLERALRLLFCFFKCGPL